MLASAENALIAALKEHRHIKNVVRTVDCLPQVKESELLSRYVADAPALYVVPGSFVARDDTMTMLFTVVGFIRNAAGQAQARKGDGKDIGLDHLLVLAIRAINNRSLGACTWYVRRGEMVDEEKFFAAGLAAIEMTFESSAIELAFDYGEQKLQELDDLRLVQLDVDLPPGASPAARDGWLREPADLSTDRPDLQATIPLTGGSAP